MLKTASQVTIPTAIAAIALGSNIGNSQAILEASLAALAQTSGITIKAKSRWYRTKAVGPTQPDYLNGCAVLCVQMSAIALLENLLAIEQQFGRVRQERWGPRTLDLDLLLYDDLILNQPNLQIPHPQMAQRAFVLVPLVEIAPDWIDPLSQRAIQDLVQDVDTCDVHLL
ncbi:MULTISPECIES: 2-amino-4-hydroxy-6-hydroxymethyldihydropteridine diphosphokinase [unclassified Anabaena]|uniref:2-amino-4-hydroxy-6- hydroxymethyldihydropteridine diphosphokinase n=1 Tax=unclassified Anabaena TaxID=2619674 RepID=UPI001447BC4F|nr:MULTISPECIES: 2-amino-4-hydroxy-6-hydroxymethyldihydropteridine diphosphokinase [unclassified Anabaena]MTJ06199.1 2-amino-4-hydroxy-6-hydroxymethyldihydropteridine diphosphokinase [Anabaena sp. UHCC 0204]MTJ54712.1 2-amino-4-hydroxy-6-hydroxymethyldihydropteridine diphosphokinase [Anabaena sp. UHCC 0253]